MVVGEDQGIGAWSPKDSRICELEDQVRGLIIERAKLIKWNQESFQAGYRFGKHDATCGKLECEHIDRTRPLSSPPLLAGEGKGKEG